MERYLSIRFLKCRHSVSDYQPSALKTLFFTPDPECCGCHAVAWVRKSPHRFLGPFYRPADEFYDWHSSKLKLRYPNTKLPGLAVESHLPSEHSCGKQKFVINKGSGKIYVRDPEFGNLSLLERALEYHAKPIPD